MISPKKAYDDQVRHSEARGITWDFDYPDWLEMWLVSGKWFERGKRKDQFCMCRYGDFGPYSPKNCYIDSTNNNQQQRWEDVRTLLPKNYREIYEVYTTTSRTQQEIAEEFGVDQSYVSKIVSRVRNKINNG